MNQYKCIFSLRVARHLIKKGFNLVGIEPARKQRKGLVFVFENTNELQSELEGLFGADNA
ncbi:DUF5659 domain-containing protein [Bacillus sp. CBEL-1]|uniref:DUF5659 domain-containing protein n=1 Tax=Bacillus sp. CBEL-1 TaxID=2502980 RepID=UPI001047B615|nr:DUF5659 domain-containing protein [Bacillus sp. CBEL-1]TDB51754.1 hypothetical protein EPL02_08375 [Bacillus sp. CBEL-1]